MAKARPEDCICSSKTGNKTLASVAFDLIDYNPKCPWHKGPDVGYGYDDWGRPNNKYSEVIGTWVAGIIIGGSAVAIVWLIAWAFIKW